MITLEIPETGKKFYLPEDLSQCDTRQYNKISELVYEFYEGIISYFDFRARGYYALLNMVPVKNNDPKYQEEKMANIYQVSCLLDSFFEEDGNGAKVLKQHYVHNPVKKVRPIVRSYYGPVDEFSNLSFGEYVDALHYFTEYTETKDLDNLYRLMATLYRPKKSFHFIRRYLADYNGDIRIDYNEHHVEARAKKFRHLYFGAVYGFYLLFASFQKYLVTAKIYWQGKELNLSILFDGKDEEPKSDIPGIGLKSILYTLAESGVFGSIKELRTENAWEVFFRMYDLVKRDRDFSAKLETKKPET